LRSRISFNSSVLLPGKGFFGTILLLLKGNLKNREFLNSRPEIFARAAIPSAGAMLRGTDAL
jgi:hypothetical protein